VNLVNSRVTRRVSGRKSDVLDGPWIWPLMTYGRLKGACRPANSARYVRWCANAPLRLQEHSRCVPRRQKALTPMNSPLDNVVSDLTGKTGLAILRRIVAGEHDPENLGSLAFGVGSAILPIA